MNNIQTKVEKLIFSHLTKFNNCEVCDGMASKIHLLYQKEIAKAYDEGWSDCAKIAREDIRDNYMPQE
jgi:hypothetical protein